MYVLISDLNPITETWPCKSNFDPGPEPNLGTLATQQSQLRVAPLRGKSCHTEAINIHVESCHAEAIYATKYATLTLHSTCTLHCGVWASNVKTHSSNGGSLPLKMCWQRAHAFILTLNLSSKWDSEQQVGLWTACGTLNSMWGSGPFQYPPSPSLRGPAFLPPRRPSFSRSLATSFGPLSC